MSFSDNYKVFWDAVHGQINIPDKLCKNVLDTLHLQRLKRLEQTNARPLYPCAHHDRFIHSLGTYHLGNITFKSTRKNSEDYVSKIVKHKNVAEIHWQVIKDEFNLACLLHDVGHAPFSHTFEQYYNVDLENSRSNILDDILLNEYSSSEIPQIVDYNSELESFKSDYKLTIKSEPFVHKQKEYKIGANPKEHEKVSAFLVLTHFRETITKAFAVNPFYIARMILGLKFSSGFIQDNPKFQVYNCFIELLNGEEVDVDKIDYIVRDQWATGNVFRNIDYIRLLSSIYIREDPVTGLLNNYFHKKTINEIIAIKETKHTIASNIHSHPVVKYDDYLIRKAVNDVIKLELADVSNTNASNQLEEIKENYVSKIVSIKALISPVKFASSKIFLPSDDDLVHFLKKHPESIYAKEWLSREYRLKALWKSPYDFNFHFSKLDDYRKKILFSRIEAITQAYLNSNNVLINKDLSAIEENYYIQKEGLQGHRIYHFLSDIKILINDEVKIETEMLSNLLQSEQKELSQKVTDYYFILYLPTPFVDKVLDKAKEGKRNGFIRFAIDEVNLYVIIEKKIIESLKNEPSSKYSEILNGLSTKRAYQKNGNEYFINTYESILDQLVNLKKIICEDGSINSKDRNYYLSKASSETALRV
jgi:hypothetical protein